MKRIFTFFLSLFLLIAPQGISCSIFHASASSGSYACILSDGVYFHTSEAPSSGIFALPKSYYVKVLSVGEMYTKVEYLTDGERTKKLTGYCLTDELTFVDYTPVNPYLYATFDVIYTAENGESGDAMLDKLTLPCTYYGSYTIGSKEYAYVLQRGEFGYVPKPADFSYSENGEYAARIEGGANSAPANTSGNGSQAALLIVLCLIVPLLAALLIKGAKPLPYELDE